MSKHLDIFICDWVILYVFFSHFLIFFFQNKLFRKILSEILSQGSHRLEKYLNLEGFLEKSLKIKYALKSTGKSL